MTAFDEWWHKEGRDLFQRADGWLVAKAAWDAAIKNAAPQDDCHMCRAQGKRSGKSLDQHEAGLPAGAAPVLAENQTEIDEHVRQLESELAAAEKEIERLRDEIEWGPPGGP